MTTTTPRPAGQPAPIGRAEKFAWQAGGIAGVTAGIVFASAARAFAGPFVPVAPDPNAPGAKALNQLASYVMTWVLDAAVIGALGALIALVFGKILGEHQVVKIGKTGLLIAIGIAFISGMITTILNAAWTAGTQG
jgi:hypothetical protein